MTGPGGELTTFGYDEAGNRTSAVLPNGITTTWAYDARNRLTRIEHKTTATGAVQAFYESAWNAQGLRATQRYSQSAGQGCLATYTYDRIGRLTQVTTAHSPSCPTIGSYVYTYDAVGNRLTEYNSLNSYGASTYAYDANDRLTAITGSAYNSKARSFAYDAAGNVIRQVVPTGSTTPPEAVTDYRWDAEGRLVGVTTPDYREIAYAYDAEGQLVGERVGSEPTAAAVTRYLADKNLAWSQILEERDGAGALKVAYQFAGTQLLKQERGAQALWSHGDHLSTRLLTDASGAIANRYVYSPFGELQAQGGTAENVHLFAGERYDANLGHTYLRARWMNPVLGRFAGMDPHPGTQRLPASLHDFGYANADPVNKWDPSGYMALAGFSMPSGAMITIALPNLGRLFLTRVAAQLVRAGARTLPLVKRLAQTCALSPSEPGCKGESPTFFIGDDYAGHARFVERALLTAPSLLNHSKYNSLHHRRNWYRNSTECAGRTGADTGRDCDEYPYFIAREGGPDNYPAIVSLEPVDISDNRGAGAKLGVMLNTCPVLPDAGQKSRFLVAPTPGIKFSFFTC